MTDGFGAPDRAKLQTRIAWFAALLAVTLAGGWMRAAPIADRALWYDEACSWGVSISGDYGDFLSWRSGDPKQPPLSFLLTKAATQVFDSQEEWVLRLPSLIAGVLSIPAAYALGRTAVGHPAGLLVALLVAVDPNMVDQSQQSRMYTLLMLATLTGLTLGLELLRDPARFGRAGPPVLGVVLALGLFANQLALALWAALFVSGAILIARDRPVLRQLNRHPIARSLGLSLLIAVLLSLPGLVELARILVGAGIERDAPGLVAVLGEIARRIGDLFGGRAMSWILCGGAVLGWTFLAREHPRAALLLCTLAGAAVAILVPFRMRHAFLDVRFLLMLQPALWLGLACLPVYAGSARARGLALGVVASAIAALGWQSLHIEDWWSHPGQFAQPLLFLEVAERAHADDAVLLVPGWISIVGHYYGVEPDPALKAAWRNGGGREPTIPDAFDAPTTWIIGGFLRRTARRSALSQTVATFADHYDVEFDPRLLDAALSIDDHVLVRVSGEGLEIEPALPKLFGRADSG